MWGRRKAEPKPLNPTGNVVMASNPKLIPAEAAASLAARAKTIVACEKYIRETVARYGGITVLEPHLAKHDGALVSITAVLKRG
jgi:hypothetical protein